jgi:hypothetical protein
MLFIQRPHQAMHTVSIVSGLGCVGLLLQELYCSELADYITSQSVDKPMNKHTPPCLNRGAGGQIDRGKTCIIHHD